MSTVNYKYIDLQSLKEDTLDDITVFKMVIELFVEIIDEFVDTFNKELPNQNWNTLFQITHKIKPNITMFGIASLEPSMLKMENYLRKEEHLEEVETLAKLCVSILIRAKTELLNELKETLDEPKKDCISRR